MNLVAVALRDAPPFLRESPSLANFLKARDLGFVNSMWFRPDSLESVVRSVAQSAEAAVVSRGNGSQAKRRAWGVRQGLSKRDLRGFERDQRRFMREEAKAETQDWFEELAQSARGDERGAAHE